MNKKYCEKGHAISNVSGTGIVLRKAVGTCQCGNHFIEEEFPVRYDHDELFEDGTVYHVYQRLFPRLCLSCGKFMLFFRVVCVSFERALLNYAEAVDVEIGELVEKFNG